MSQAHITGFIGSHVVHTLFGRYPGIRLRLMHLSHDNLLNLQELDMELFPGNITKRADVEALGKSGIRINKTTAEGQPRQFGWAGRGAIRPLSVLAVFLPEACGADDGVAIRQGQQVLVAGDQIVDVECFAGRHQGTQHRLVRLIA